MNRTIIAVIAAISIAACSTTSIQVGAVHQVAPELSGIQISPSRVKGCEITFKAWQDGKPVDGCLYRPAFIASLKARVW